MTMRQAVNPFASFVPESGEIKRLIGSTAWVSGGRWTLEVPRGLDIDRLMIEISGTITLSSAATTVSAAAPSQLIAAINWKADSAKMLEDTTGILAAVGNFERGLARDLIAPGTGAAAHTVYAAYALDRVTPDGPRPKDSLLHTSQPYMGSQFLNVTFGTVAACYSNFGTGAVGSTDLTVNVYTVEVQEGTALGMTEFRWIRRHTLYDQSFSAANAAAIINGPTNTFMRGVKLLAMNTSNNEPADALLQNVKIRSGPNLRLDISAAALRVANKQEFGLQGTQLSAIPGLYFADMLSNHKLNTLWSLQGASECVLELRLAANTRIVAQFINYDMLPAPALPQRVAMTQRAMRVKAFLNRVANTPLARK